MAELLGPLTLLMNRSGLKAGWRAIQGSPDFFSITKKMHNALQGGDINLSKIKKDIYEDVVCQNSQRIHLDNHDLVVVHDPQPLPLIRHYPRRCPWFWRCHIDLTSPHMELWNYLRDFIDEYDSVLLSSRSYELPMDIPQYLTTPGIDPFSIKNKTLSQEEIDDRLDHHSIPTDLPLVVQISRFDKWKDPEGVIEAFRKVRQEVDCTLVLLGNVATDDPEGEEVYQSLLDCREERIIILSRQDTALVNALQRTAAVVVQKSLREGFGLTVTEAMWKGAAVVAGDTGGIRCQIEDGENGYLVSSVDETAERIVELLKSKDKRKAMGQKARRTVVDNFLLTHCLEAHLDMYGSVRTLYRVEGPSERHIKDEKE